MDLNIAWKRIFFLKNSLLLYIFFQVPGMEPRVLYVAVLLLLLKYWATVQALKETFHSTNFYVMLRITKQLKINYD